MNVFGVYVKDTNKKMRVECASPLDAKERSNAKNGEKEMELPSTEEYNFETQTADNYERANCLALERKVSSLKKQVAAMETEVQLGITELQACNKVNETIAQKSAEKDREIHQLQSSLQMFHSKLLEDLSSGKERQAASTTQLRACVEMNAALEREIKQKGEQIQEKDKEIQVKDKKIQELQTALHLFTYKNCTECNTMDLDRLRNSYKDILFYVDKYGHSEPKNTSAESKRLINKLEGELILFARDSKAQYVRSACCKNPKDTVQMHQDFWDTTTDKVDCATNDLKNLKVLLRDTKSSLKSKKNGLVKLINSLRALVQHCEEDKTGNPFNHSVVNETPTNFFEVRVPKGFEIWLGTVFGYTLKAENNKGCTDKESLISLMNHWSNHMSKADHQKYIDHESSNTIIFQDAVHLASQKGASRLLKGVFPYVGGHKQPEIKLQGDKGSFNSAFSFFSD